jgi:hypothetical protein
MTMNQITLFRIPAGVVVALMFAATLALGLTDNAPAQVKEPAQTPGDIVSKATTLETADFLKVPANLDAKQFTVAKTPPVVDVCFFEGLADRGKGTLWSSWGDGCIATNGKYYTSVGDHLGKDANSYVYEYDPMTRALRRVVDVLQSIMHMLGLYGHGKIHAGIHQGADGWLYITTYWGKPKEVDAAFEKGFPGSITLRYDPKTGKTENLGAIVPKQGLPASYFDAQRQLIYFHAVYKGDVVVYDLKSRVVKFKGGADDSAGHRTFLPSPDGRVFFSGKDGGLLYYDPAKNTQGKTSVQLPAGMGKKNNTLRAAAHPTKAGLVYGMTAAGQMFVMDPVKETVKDLGPNFPEERYTAVMVMSPDEKYLYFAPGAHGGGNRTGGPVVQYEIATGQGKVLAFLRDPLQQKFNYMIGGTYNLQIDASGARLYITFNGAAGTARSAFGKPSVVVLHIPQSER